MLPFRHQASGGSSLLCQLAVVLVPSSPHAVRCCTAIAACAHNRPRRLPPCELCFALNCPRPHLGTRVTCTRRSLFAHTPRPPLYAPPSKLLASADTRRCLRTLLRHIGSRTTHLPAGRTMSAHPRARSSASKSAPTPTTDVADTQSMSPSWLLCAGHTLQAPGRMVYHTKLLLCVRALPKPSASNESRRPPKLSPLAVHGSRISTRTCC